MNIYKFCLLVCLLPTAWIAGAQRLRGIVRDADRGTPLAGVSISLGQTEDIDRLAITTGADGAFAHRRVGGGRAAGLRTLRLQ